MSVTPLAAASFSVVAQTRHSRPPSSLQALVFTSPWLDDQVSPRRGELLEGWKVQKPVPFITKPNQPRLLGASADGYW